MARTATTISWAGCGHGCGCIDITHSILRPETGNVDRSTILPSRAPTRSTGRTRPWRVRRVAELTSRINPMTKLDRVRLPDPRPRGVPRATVELVLAQVPRAQRRDRLLFRLVYETGLRIGEALATHVDDLDLTPDDERLSVLGKGGRRRTLR